MGSRVVISLYLLAGLAQSTAWAGKADLPGGHGSAAVLRSRISEVLARHTLRGAQIGVMVARLDDGREIFNHNGDELLIPASNVKLVTTAAALHHLGPDYHFRTEFYAEPDASGRVEGNLYIKGYGDPYITPERAWYAANRLAFLGITHIQGNIIVDDTFFAGHREANGWEQDRTSYAYMAPSGALSVGFNALLVLVKPGSTPGTEARVLVDPPTQYAPVRGRVQTISRGKTSIGVEVRQSGDRNEIWVSGRIRQDDAGRAYWRRITNPPVFAGEVFRSVFEQVGITVNGAVKAGTVPDGHKKIFTLTSPRLAELSYWINKHSNNFMSAQLARTLGAEVYGAPGTWDKGAKAIQHFLAEQVGIPKGSYELGNASGLHSVNRFTPRQMIQILDFMSRQPKLWPEYVTSFATASASGTLSSRMKDSEAAHLLRAKTGTLSVASALSGYVHAKSGELLAFSVLVNNYRTGVSSVWALQDELGSLLAAWDFDVPDSQAPTAMHPGQLHALPLSPDSPPEIDP